MEAQIDNGKLIIDNENEFLWKIINSVPASIHIMKLNENGNTLPVWMNKEYSKILGYNLAERQKIGINYQKDELYHPEDIEIVREAIKKIINKKVKGYAEMFMFRVRCKNKNWKWILSSANLITINNDPNYMLSVLIDLSEKMPEYNLLVGRYMKEIAQLKNKLKISNLTKTEKEIIASLATGQATPEIAKKRNRSYDTINNHKRNIFKKLNIHSIAELVNFAIENGLN